METKLLYLEDTYQFESNAKIINANKIDDQVDVVLDQTIFYPQGGGQPADHGLIESKNGSIKITDVRLDENGIVHHLGEMIFGEFSADDEVSLTIDKEKRIAHAKIHSAGHLIDCAIEKMGYSFEAGKGFHFPDGPYVEYIGEVEDKEKFKQGLEEMVNQLVEKNIAVIKEKLSPEEAEERNIWAPPGKSARVVSFEGFEGCGCGGTHVNETSEIGKITIRKVKAKKGKIKVSYTVEK